MNVTKPALLQQIQKLYEQKTTAKIELDRASRELVELEAATKVDPSEQQKAHTRFCNAYDRVRKIDLRIIELREIYHQKTKAELSEYSIKPYIGASNV